MAPDISQNNPPDIRHLSLETCKQSNYFPPSHLAEYAGVNRIFRPADRATTSKSLTQYVINKWSQTKKYRKLRTDISSTDGTVQNSMFFQFRSPSFQMYMFKQELPILTLTIPYHLIIMGIFWNTLTYSSLHLRINMLTGKVRQKWLKLVKNA